MSFKRRIAGALAAAILTIGAPTAALAYGPPVVPVVQQEGQGTFENMIAALENLGAETEQLATRTDLTLNNIRLFDAEYLASQGDAAAIDQAVALHADQIQYAQATVANNEVVLKVLEMVQVPVESVVAVDNLDAGDLAIYFHPNPGQAFQPQPTEAAE